MAPFELVRLGVSVVAGDYFVKPEDLQHVPSTSFANSCHMSSS